MGAHRSYSEREINELADAQAERRWRLRWLIRRARDLVSCSPEDALEVLSRAMASSEVVRVVIEQERDRLYASRETPTQRPMPLVSKTGVSPGSPKVSSHAEDP